MDSPALLHIDGLRRRFGEVVALDGIGFSVAEGEVVALLGENGAGKSTLVEVLVGGLAAHGGTLHLAGAAYRPSDPRQARAQGVVAVHQHFQLVEAFTVVENMRLAAPELAADELGHRWQELSRDLGVELPDLQGRVCDLGVGERQWVEIGKALVRAPSLLLLDEPTAVLTPGEAHRLFEAVLRLAARGTAVLFITHRLDEVQRVADRVVVLRRGRVQAEMEATADPALMAEAMIGSDLRATAAPEHRAGDVVAALRGVSLPPRLQPLDLELRRGELTVLAGVDGNGQVAAAERLAGLCGGPGSVEVGSCSFVNPEPYRLRCAGVSVVPSDRARQGLLAELTVAENLVLGQQRELAGPGGWLRPSTVREHGERLIGHFKIAGRAEQAAGELSGGNQQKVLVARAVAAQPKLLVAMHPSRGLDVAARNAVHSVLFEACDRGAAVLVVTSDLEEARALGDRILVFSHGRVVGEGDRSTAAEVLSSWVGGAA